MREIEKTNQNRIKHLLIGMVVGIIVGMAMFYLLLNFSIIKPYYIFHGARNLGYMRFPGNGNFTRGNFTRGPG
jgi:hypothetical protein